MVKEKNSIEQMRTQQIRWTEVKRDKQIKMEREREGGGAVYNCVPAQDNHGFVANAIIELQPKISENPTSGQLSSSTFIENFRI